MSIVMTSTKSDTPANACCSCTNRHNDYVGIRRADFSRASERLPALCTRSMVRESGQTATCRKELVREVC